ncbi:galactosylgalactosylxylosylprotein 3-beta-glucuronosyltransferase I [Neodiprion virginianus]|uniref:galactosylgalactosylxylosylprotein 3-beta-glucuronosyltransferase I n=1 Tax=Neodiprion virginianus TaxID=2961670 RepID=UPI001EE6BA04|nr:galactosylgalactosylxylosylprotein 3-beta-glucuronosyltransferase I [Neodiprion virginianus]
MPFSETIFVVDGNCEKSTMRNRRFLECTFVLVLVTVIILQWIRYKNLQEEWLSEQRSTIIQRLDENARQTKLISEDMRAAIKSIETQKRMLLQMQGKEYYRNKPTIYAITPTFARFVQKAELTRLAQTFVHIPTFHWILVEDSTNKTNLVTNLLMGSGLAFTHLAIPTPPNYKLGRNDPNWKKPRGVEQRNAGLKWLRENLTPDDEGIVFFADDDNTYSIKLFEEMEKIKHVGVWPVGLVGGLMVEKPICDEATRKVVGFNSAWKSDRPFPIDMAGFAFKLKLLFQHKDAWFSFEIQSGYQESEILRHITTRDQLEPLADCCKKVYVWHTRTEPPKLSAEQLLTKKGKKSNEGIEV